MSFSERFQVSSTAAGQFADRIDEVAAFDLALSAYGREVDRLRSGEWSATDPIRPRRNVLSFYGVGGIGKTTLLAKLADRLLLQVEQPNHWPIRPETPEKLAVCRIDATDFDPEDALLALRASFMSLESRFSAFDICLSLYWRSRHGNESVADAFQHRGRLQRFAERAGVGQHIQAGMQEVCTAVLGTAIPGISLFRGFGDAGKKMWRKRIEATALRDCPGLEDLLAENPSDDVLAYYGYAMAWDLEQIQREENCWTVVLIDTFEAASPRAAAFLNVLAYMLPNVLFVVGGRNALDWGAPDSDAQFRGPNRWPHLALGAVDEPRQHLVGYLSVEDRRKWLDSVLKESCSEEVREHAASESHGLPVHLDLIAQHILEVARERVVEIADATGDLGTLARRVLQDLSPSQRLALLAASLFARFDTELVRVAADLPNTGPVNELISRPYVESSALRYPYRYRLHELLSSVFREATGLGDDQWSYEDWTRSARRASDILRERVSDASDPQDVIEHAELLFSLVATFGLDYEWLPELAERLTSVSVWSSEWSGTRMSEFPPRDTWSSALAECVAIIMKRQDRNRRDVASDLEAIIERFPGDDRLDVARYFCGQAQRDAGWEDESLRTMEALLEGRMAQLAAKGVIHVYRRRGDFQAALMFLNRFEGTLSYSDRVRGEILWTQGQIGDACRSFALGELTARSRNDYGEQALCLASEAWCRSLMGERERTLELVAAARELLSIHFQSFADLMASLSEAFLAAIDGDYTLLDAVEAGGIEVGQTSITAYAQFARCVADSVESASSERCITSISRLESSVHSGYFEYLLVIARSLNGIDAEHAQWTDHDVVSAWILLVDSLRSHLRHG